MRRTKIRNRHFIENVPLPQYGGKYSVIKHTLAIDLIAKELDSLNMKILEESFKSNTSGTVVAGTLLLDHNLNDEAECQIIYLNSYDKTKAFQIAAGLRLKDQNISFYLGNSVYGKKYRRHIGKAENDIKISISNMISTIRDDFKRLEHQMLQLRGISLTKGEMFDILMGLYIDNELISDTQMSKIKREMKSPTLGMEKYENSAFHLYMIICMSYADMAANTYFKNHQELNTYFNEKFTLNSHGDQLVLDLEEKLEENV